MIQLSIGQTHWSPLELALAACWAATFVAVAREVLKPGNLRHLRQLAVPIDLILLAAAFAVCGALSLLWIAEGGSSADAVREYRRVILAPLVLAPAVTLLRRRGEVALILPWLAVPAALIAILAIGQLAFQTSVVEIGRIARPIGTFTHPNNLAFYLERTVWFAPLLAIRRPGSSGTLSWAGSILIGVGCAATLSRGALLAITAGGIVYFWERVRPDWRRYLALGVGIGAVAFATRTAFGGGDSTSNRTAIWRASIEMLRDHPLRGVGLDQFLSQYGRRYVEPEGWAERYTSHPHNMVLDFWLRLGLPGLLLLWASVEVVIKRARIAIALPPLTVQRAAIAMLVAGFVHGLIDNSFFLMDLATFTWLGLALATLGPDKGD